MTLAKPSRTATDDHLLIRSVTPDGASPLEVSTLTVLIGPNNSGKSAALRDLVLLAGNFDLAGQELQAGDEVATKVIRDVSFVGKLTLERLARGLTSFADASGEGTTIQGVAADLRTPYRCTLGPEIKSVLYRPVLTARSVRMTALGQIMPLRVAYLPPERAAALLAPALAASPLQAPEHLLQVLRYAEPAIHEELDAAFHTLFPELHVRLDTTELVNLCLRVAHEFPAPSDDPIAAVRQWGALPRADQIGAGQQTVLAILLTMLLCQGRVVLLDQPELGLHPAEARQLGAWIARNAARCSCQVLLATHSAELLRGITETSPETTILRLSRTRETSTVQSVPAEVGGALARFPIFASQQGTDCLLRSGVVIVPSAEDRVVYETVAQRFAGGGDFRFLQAYGDRNLAALTKTLRKAGLPTCVVAQLEVLQSETGFSELVKAVTGTPPPTPWLATRERLAKHVEGLMDPTELSAATHEVESFLDQLKKGGAAETARGPTPPHSDAREKWLRLQREQLSSVPPELRVWAEELLEDLKHQGIFISPKGNFAGWLAGEGLSSDPEIAFAKAVQTLHRNECPADLRAFVTEILTFLRLVTTPSRAARIRKMEG